MTERKKEMLSALSSGIDLTKPTLSSLHEGLEGNQTAKEIRAVKSVIVNLINILLEEV